MNASAHSWPRVAIFGAGAVGCFHGAHLAMAGARVTLIGRAHHVQAIHRDGLVFESGGTTRHVALQASESVQAVEGADLVLVCVKSRDTAAAGREIAPWLKPGAVVVSLQNGVDNARVLREACGLDAMAAVVYVAASMPASGHVRHAGRGDLVLGEVGPPLDGVPRDPQRLARIAEWFARSGVPCEQAPDVRPALWVKLVMNCVFNAISALGRARYGRMIQDPGIRDLMAEVVRECVAVARAEGVPLEDATVLFEAAMTLGEAMSAATSSMAQDLSLGRPTENDALNGYVAQRAQALGLPAPANAALAALVRLLEAGVLAGGAPTRTA